MRCAWILILSACVADKPALPQLDFAAYGDCRDGHDVHRSICTSILATGAKFVVSTGDLVGSPDFEQDWVKFREITRELRAKVGYYAAPGNHDVSDRRPFEMEFGLEKTYFEKRIGDVHLFLLDSNSYFSDAEQLQWLEERAKASDARHKFAAFHHPPFLFETWGDSTIRDRIHPLLLRLKFCAVFCGHHHSFYTTTRDGLRYVVTAGGGAPLYGVDAAQAHPRDQFKNIHHYVGCRMLANKIAAQVFNPDGREEPDLAFTLCEH